MTWAILLFVTFLASAVQSATGFAFAMIVVPAYLLLLGSADAVQMTIILSVVMSLSHLPKLRSNIPMDIFKFLAIGALIGFPVGLYIYSRIDLTVLKAMVAIFVIMISAQNAWAMWQRKKPKKTKAGKTLYLTGFVSGILGACLAMPGPLVMLYLSRTTLSKDEIRATMISFFVFAYIAILVLQMVVIGIAKETWVNSATMIPAALLGVLAGHQLSKKIDERLFREIILSILILTGVMMLINL